MYHLSTFDSSRNVPSFTSTLAFSLILTTIVPLKANVPSYCSHKDSNVSIMEILLTQSHFAGAGNSKLEHVSHTELGHWHCLWISWTVHVPKRNKDSELLDSYSIIMEITDVVR